MASRITLDVRPAKEGSHAHGHSTGDVPGTPEQLCALFPCAQLPDVRDARGGVGALLGPTDGDSNGTRRGCDRDAPHLGVSSLLQLGALVAGCAGPGGFSAG